MPKDPAPKTSGHPKPYPCHCNCGSLVHQDICACTEFNHLRKAPKNLQIFKDGQSLQKSHIICNLQSHLDTLMQPNLFATSLPLSDPLDNSVSAVKSPPSPHIAPSPHMTWTPSPSPGPNPGASPDLSNSNGIVSGILDGWTRMAACERATVEDVDEEEDHKAAKHYTSEEDGSFDYSREDEYHLNMDLLSRKRVEHLAQFQPQPFDSCINSCACYVGPNADLQSCRFCGEPRFNPSGKPQKRFNYIPLIPRLSALYQSPDMIEKMAYRHQHQSKDGVFEDVFDGKIYKNLRQTKVTVGDTEQDHTFFQDETDIALGFATNGFAPFKN
ncbi:hypothetical protein H1R20_g13784, partial [Candolleomyces eurysporus]